MENKFHTSINEFKNNINESNPTFQEEEDLYRDIDWIDIELDMTQWFNRQPQKLDYDTFTKTFATMKEIILQYKILNKK